MRRWICSLAAVAIIGSGVLQGHHSIAAVYDSNHQASLDGVITQFQLINPHPLLWIDVTDTNGQTQRWRLEMDNRSELVAVGVTADTLKPGDRVRVKGSLARSQPQAIYLLRLDRPSDGFWYEQVGGSPKIRNR
jgi:hypothetical protein